MRRNEKEIKNREEIEAIIRQAEVCHLGLSENNRPYVIPMNFGFRDNCLYFHCAKSGKKLDIIRKNNQVCVEMDIDHELVMESDVACEGTAKYRSVIGFGRAYILRDSDEKILGLNAIMDHYTGKSTFEYLDKQIQNVTIIKVEIDKIIGKKSGY
jgi:nitroimidazol reductase NimA-like FMN-containing flavoprotein (pyridoxamine 5'-phosphate oxidase superfamily)